MSFESAGNYMIKVAQRFGLQRQVGAGVVIEQAKQFFAESYPLHAKSWKPTKFVKKTLHIKAANSASASALFLHKSAIMEEFAKHELLKIVQEIQIER